MSDLSVNQGSIAFAIKRIQFAGGESNHATFIADERRNIYIQFLTDRGGDVVEGELTANRFLPSNWQLGDQQHEILENHGWELTEFNWVKSWDVGDDDDRDDVAQQAVHILAKAYKVPSSRPLRREMRLEPDHHPHPAAITGGLGDALSYVNTVYLGDARYTARAIRVAGLVLEDGGDEAEAVAGALLDTVWADGKPAARLHHIAHTFGNTVMRLVGDCRQVMEDPDPDWVGRRERFAAVIRGWLKDPQENQMLLRVCLADHVESAERMLRSYADEGPRLFRGFTGGQDGALWYQGLIVDTFVPFASPMVDRLHDTVSDLERLCRARVRDPRSIRAVPARRPGSLVIDSGVVDTSQRHIEMRYLDGTDVVARLALAGGRRIVYERLVADEPGDQESQKVIAALEDNLDRYLRDRVDPDPWTLIQYHVASPSNAYDAIRWTLVDGSD